VGLVCCSVASCEVETGRCLIVGLLQMSDTFCKVVYEARRGHSRITAMYTKYYIRSVNQIIPSILTHSSTPLSITHHSVFRNSIMADQKGGSSADQQEKRKAQLREAQRRFSKQFSCKYFISQAEIKIMDMEIGPYLVFIFLWQLWNSLRRPNC
jgi:hypothetical protein